MRPIVKAPLKFGAIGASMVLLMFLIFYLSDANPLIEMKMFDFFIIPIFLFFGIKEFRDTFNAGLMEFWQGMTAGFIIYASIAIISSVFTLMMLEIDQSILDSYITDRMAILAEQKNEMIEQMGEATYLTAEADVKNASSIDLALDSLFKKSAIGLMLTIMISVIMRRKPKDAAQN